MLSATEKLDLLNEFKSYYNDDSNHLAYVMRAISNGDDAEYYIDDIQIDGYTAYSGCTKIALVNEDTDWVFKIPLLNDTYDCNDEEYIDYCKHEAINYARAVMAGIGECFAETYYLGNVDGINIYAQARYDIDDCENDDAAFTAARKEWFDDGLDEEEVDRNSSCFYDWDSDEQLRPLTFQAWDCKLASAFWDFIEHYLISDLHSGNYYYDEDSNHLVMVDFSGFGCYVTNQNPDQVEYDFNKLCVA